MIAAIRRHPLTISYWAISVTVGVVLQYVFKGGF